MVTLRSQRSTEKASPPETPDLAGFQFYKFMYYGMSWEELMLPDKFASALRGRELREMKLRVAGGGGRRAWDVEVLVDEYGDMCLGDGWREFASANGLELGQLLVFRFDGASLLTVTVFDDSDCGRRYQQEEEEEEEGAEGKSSLPAGSGSGSSEEEEWDGTEKADTTEPPGSGSEKGGSSEEEEADTTEPEPAPSQFSVMLRKCHLGVKQQQYLNVPADFDQAHGYAKRSKVELQMRGESWTVNLKHSKRSRLVTRTAFRYGWHQFCVDNSLGLGDTCFFHVLPEGSGIARRGNDQVLRVEVRKPDGTILR